MQCPICGGAMYAEFVNIGVGYQQVTPRECGSCEYREGEDEDEAIERLHEEN